jgi:hypothetical protein
MIGCCRRATTGDGHKGTPLHARRSPLAIHNYQFTIAIAIAIAIAVVFAQRIDN